MAAPDSQFLFLRDEWPMLFEPAARGGSRCSQERKSAARQRQHSDVLHDPFTRSFFSSFAFLPNPSSVRYDTTVDC